MDICFNELQVQLKHLLEAEQLLVDVFLGGRQVHNGIQIF